MTLFEVIKNRDQIPTEHMVTAFMIALPFLLMSLFFLGFSIIVFFDFAFWNKS